MESIPTNTYLRQVIAKCNNKRTTLTKTPNPFICRELFNIMQLECHPNLDLSETRKGVCHQIQQLYQLCVDNH